MPFADDSQMNFYLLSLSPFQHIRHTICGLALDVSSTFTFFFLSSNFIVRAIKEYQITVCVLRCECCQWAATEMCFYYEIIIS